MTSSICYPKQLPILFDTFLQKLLDIISSLTTPKRPSSVIDCNSAFDEFILPSLSDISSLLKATHSCSQIYALPLGILKQVTNPIAIVTPSLSIAIIISSSNILPLFDYSNDLLFNITAYKLDKIVKSALN